MATALDGQGSCYQKSMIIYTSRPAGAIQNEVLAKAPADASPSRALACMQKRTWLVMSG